MSSQNPNPCCKCTDPQYYVTLNTQGPQGRQGQNGVDGFSPTINVVSNTPSQYVLSITDINGTKQTPNLKASLPQGGTTGMVLTRYGNEDGEYAWQNLPIATTLNNGITRLATLEDFFPTNTEEPYEYSEECALSPQSLASFLGAIPTSMEGLFNGAGQICKTDNVNGTLYLPWIHADNYFTSPSYHVVNNTNKEFAALYHEGGPYDIVVGAGVWGGNLYLDGTNIYKGHDTTTKIVDTSDIATTTTAGIVKPDGTTITVDTDGTLHGATSYNLPIANATTLGGIKVGDGLSITDDGTLSASGGGGTSLENVSTITDGISIGNQDAVTDGFKSKVEITGSNKENGFPIPIIELASTQYEGGSVTNDKTVYLGINKDNRLSIFSSDPNNIPSTGKFTLSSIDIGVDVTGGSSKFYINSTTQSYTNGRPVGSNSYSLLPQTGALKYWKGTAEEYTAIATKNVDTLYNVTDTQQVYLGTIPLTGGASAKQSTFVNYPESSIVKMNTLKSDTQVASGYPDAMKIVIGDSASTSYNIYFSYPGSSLPNADGTGYTQSSSYQNNGNLIRGTSTGTTIPTALLYYYNRQVYYTDSLDNLKSYVSGFNASQAIYIGSGSVASGQLQQLTSVPEYVINNFTGG